MKRLCCNVPDGVDVEGRPRGTEGILPGVEGLLSLFYCWGRVIGSGYFRMLGLMPIGSRISKQIVQRNLIFLVFLHQFL